MSKPIFEMCRHKFTAEELQVLGAELAEEIRAGNKLKEDRTTVAAEFAAQLKASAKRASALAEKVTLGYELRETECSALLNVPDIGTKTIVRRDTSEEVRRELMTEEERQVPLFSERVAG